MTDAVLEAADMAGTVLEPDDMVEAVFELVGITTLMLELTIIELVLEPDPVDIVSELTGTWTCPSLIWLATWRRWWR